jgi:FkbM family methyltransferase
MRILVKALPDRMVLIEKANFNLVKRMDYDRCDIYLNVESETEYDVHLHSCKKELGTIQWIERFMKEGDVMFDVGSNVGAYALVASKFTRGKAKIYAFEPSFSTFANLSRNVFLNGCSGSVMPLNIALSDKTCFDDFIYLELTAGSSCHAFGENVLFTGEEFYPVFRQTVIGYTIDELIATFQIGCPSLLKIDVDGIEVTTLKGAEKTFWRKELRSVVVLIDKNSEETHDSIFGIMIVIGFELDSKWRCILENDVDSEQFLGCYNCIFIRRQEGQ